MRHIKAPGAERELGGRDVLASVKSSNVPGQNPSLLVVDIVNTNIVCGLYQGSELVRSARFHSSCDRTADEYYSLLVPSLFGAELMDLSAVIIASVVPELGRMWQHLFLRHFDLRATFVTAHSPLGLKYKVANPSFIGADLVVNAFAAWQKYQKPAIIIDLGTATTVQFVTASGVFEGTAIIPGMKTGARHLFEKAALLSDIEISSPPALMGTNTRDALLSGIVNSHAFLLETYIHKLKLQFFDHKGIITVLTGGMADLLKPLMPSVDIVDKTLTLEGLRLAWKKLKDSSTSEPADI